MRILDGEEGDCGIGPGIETPAQKIQNSGQLGRQFDRADITGGARAPVLDMVGAVHNQHQVMAEENLQPIADAALSPRRIVFLANFLRGANGSSDALDLAQHASAAVSDRLRKQLVIAIDRHFIRPPRRDDDRDDKAGHRNGDDQADRQEQAPARPVPARLIAVLGDVRLRRSSHAPPFGGVPDACTIRQKRLRFRLQFGPGTLITTPIERESAVEVNGA